VRQCTVKKPLLLLETTCWSAPQEHRPLVVTIGFTTSDQYSIRWEVEELTRSITVIPDCQSHTVIPVIFVHFTFIYRVSLSLCVLLYLAITSNDQSVSVALLLVQNRKCHKRRLQCTRMTSPRNMSVNVIFSAISVAAGSCNISYRISAVKLMNDGRKVNSCWHW